ncbi:hypothetical protein [Mesorhizobium sp. A623]
MATTKEERSRLKRHLKFLTKHQGNPLSQAFLTKADSRNGVFVTVEMDGKVRKLSLNSAQMTAITWYALGHLKMDANREGTLPPSFDGNPRLRRHIDTFRNFGHFREFVACEKQTPGLHRKQPRTDEGDRITEHHERLVELFAYAVLPVWAKDEKAFVKRWGIVAGDHCFRAMLAPTDSRNQQTRRAA